MIYCPECGTANRNSSTFCDECGQRLDAFALVKCPDCGVMNPVQQASCNGCGARLLSAAAGPEGVEAGLTSKGLFLPTKSAALGEDAADAAQEPVGSNEQMPAWLLALEAQWQAESNAPAGSADEDSDLQDRPEDLPTPLPPAQEVESPEDDQPPHSPATTGPGVGPDEEEQEEEEVTLAEAEELGISPWLAELQGVAGAKAQPREEITEGMEGEAPPWLTELRDAAGAGPEEPETLEATEGEAADWLLALHMTAKARAPKEEVPEADKGEIPDQLAEMPPGEIEAVNAGEPEPGGEIETLDAVEPEPPVPVTALEGEEVSEAMAEPATPEGREEDEEALDWAAELEMEEADAPPILEEDALDRSTGIPLPAEAWTEEDEIREAERTEPPDWLAELGELLEDEELEDFEPPVPDKEEVFFAAEALSEDAQLEEATEAPDGPEQAVMDQEEGRAAIPAWMLALEPPEVTGEAEPPAPETWAGEPMEGTGLLAGIQGILPVEAIIAQPRSASQRAVLEPFPASDAPQAQLFAEIVGRPPQAEPKELEEPRRQGLGTLPRSLIFLALIAAVTAPLLLAEPLWSRNLVAGPLVRNLHEEVELLDEGSLVLLAFDYDPSTTDEMNLLAQMLVDHLMERGVGIVAVSLYPAGPPVAQAMLDEAAAQHPDYAGAYGQRYVNLGYLPGQATAVRLLGQSLPMALPQDFQGTLLSDLPLVDGVASLQDFALALELAASEQSVRWWVEQAATPYNVTLAGAVSASVVPFVQPYYQTEPRQLVGLVGGLPDAAAYATLRTDPEAQEGTLTARLDSLTGGHLVLILVLVSGSLVRIVRRSRGGR